MPRSKRKKIIRTFMLGFSKISPFQPGSHCSGRGTSKRTACSPLDLFKTNRVLAKITAAAVSNTAPWFWAAQSSASMVDVLMTYAGSKRVEASARPMIRVWK